MLFQLTLPYNHSEQEFTEAVHRYLGTDSSFRILKRSIDARQHHAIRVHYSISTDTGDPADEVVAAVAIQRKRLAKCFDASRRKPVVVGSGPAGIFCVLWLRLHGFQPILLEQGPPMRQRVRDMARFMKTGILNPYSNIGFGAGGAGTYSDGKLITRIRSPFIPFVMQQFVVHGAPESIRFLYNPHLGSNRIRACINRMLNELEQSGVRMLYNTRFVSFDADNRGAIVGVRTATEQCFDTDALFLATGHSARDVYSLLRARDVSMDLKEFAIGVRVEHPAGVINDIRYGAGYGSRYPGIETAQYKLTRTWKNEQRTVYSFCMCPGGYVLNASTDTEGVTTNGMSNYLKSGRFSNSAIVVNVSRSDLADLGYHGIDAGLLLQRELEQLFRASVNSRGSVHVIPAQRLQDFLQGTASTSVSASSCINPIAASPIHSLLPSYVFNDLRRGFTDFERKMPGFTTHPEAQLFGIESRTSSPYRIERDEAILTSPTHDNLFPIGEGAGFAGGISSAAVDGIRAAQAWISTFIEAAPMFASSASKES